MSKFFTSFIKNRIGLLSWVALAALVLSACQTAVAQPSPTDTAAVAVIPTQTTAPTATPAPTATSIPTAVPTEPPTATTFPEAVINVAQDSTLGPILVGDHGLTLYIFTKDEADKSNCDASCQEKWPPLLTQGKPTLGDGVDDSLVGTASLPDGSMIVTYNHMPLYYWHKDTKAGDTTGQGVGEVWFVINPDGEKVEQAVSSSTNSNGGASSDTGPAVSTEPMISVSQDPTLGPILVGDNGMTLYMYTRDLPDTVNCNAACQEKWPPLLTQGKPTLGDGVDDSLVGTASLPDGSMIVTYNHMPLYYWYKDTKAGDTTGQGVGEVWYVVNPDGEIVK